MTEMQGCGAESPHTPLKVRRKQRDVQVTVFCNRPCGHEGNHAWGDRYTARTAEWTRDGKVVR